VQTVFAKKEQAAGPEGRGHAWETGVSPKGEGRKRKSADDLNGKVQSQRIPRQGKDRERYDDEQSG